MKPTCYLFLSIKKMLKNIHLVDKCLILFMIVLLLQSAFTIFFQTGTNSELNHIDVIVRTSAASIFGYFLSANFVRHSSKKETSDLQPLQFDENKIIEDNSQKELPSTSKIQIIVATIIGLICLVSLLLLRNISVWNETLAYNPSITATIAQFRDFISGCVGFLIGCPTNKKD